MKITRRQFLLQAAAAAITTAAGWAVTGVRVEDTPAPAPPELEYYVYDDFSNPDGTQATPGPGTRVVVDTSADERAVMTFENGRASWDVPMPAGLWIQSSPGGPWTRIAGGPGWVLHDGVVEIGEVSP